MRPVFVAFFALAIASAHGQGGYDAAVAEEIPRMEQHGAWTIERSGGPPTRGFDMKYLRCAWVIDPAVRAISGTVTSYFTATTDLDQLIFDLSDSLVVDAVEHHGVPLAFDHQTGDLLVIDLPATLPTGHLDSLSVTYHGVPPTTGFGSFETDLHDSIPVLWTLSEPYGASDWWPCKKDLNDKIDSLDTYVTTPNAYRAAGNGLLVDPIPSGGRTTWHWKHRYPIDHYLIATAVTNYQVDIRYAVLDGDSVPMVTYAYPENFFIAQLNAGDVLQQMALYSQLFGIYPFAREKYGHAQMGWGGGMEHQTMTFVGGFTYDLAAHELAHQWFGDKVTCGSWADIWLNEGFATYLSGLCYEYLAPQYWHDWKFGKINNVISEPDGSVFCTDTLDNARLFSGRLTYNKGAMLVHMLRWVCGDSAFYQGLRNYLNEPELAYGTALTADLQTHLEATSGLDLTTFFTQWYTGQGYPTYSAAWTQNTGGQVDLQLSQITSDPSVSFFVMPVPIRFSGGGMDTTIVLNNTVNAQNFSFHLPFQADSSLIDPDLWLVCGNNSVTQVNEMADGAHELVLYPNPAQDRLSWRDIRPGATARTAIIRDIMGRKVLEGSAAADSLDISALAPGNYIVELKGKQPTIRARFVKR